jgi:hypothetical protein
VKVTSMYESKSIHMTYLRSHWIGGGASFEELIGGGASFEEFGLGWAVTVF